MRLQDYPIPRNKSKRGMHWSASCYPEEAHWQDRLALCRDMGIGWIKFVDDGGASGMNVYRECWHNYGIIPIVRFYIGLPGQCGPREADAIKRIADTLGFRTYFELCNEPDLPDEWGNKQPQDWLYRAVDAYVGYAPRVWEAGGLPGTFALASGAFGQMRIDEHGNEIPPVRVNFIKLIADKLGLNTLRDIGAWVSMHNYTANHPIDYPYDDVNQQGKPLTVEEYNRHPRWAWDDRPMEAINEQRARDKNPGDTIFDDDTCFGAYRVFLSMLDELGLADTPVITTEGGPTLTRGDDGRYPKIHIDLMVEMMQQMYREMAGVPRYLAHCHWLLYNTTGGWMTDTWMGGAQDYSKAIALFKNNPVGTWGEVISYDTTPQPPTTPTEPNPPVVQPPELDWQIPEWNEARPALFYAMPGQTVWRLVKAELSPDNMANTVWVNVYDGNGERVNVIVKARNADGTEETLPYKPGEPYNRPIWKNDTLRVWIGQDNSDAVESLHTRYWNIPGVNTFHVGYILTFVKTQTPDSQQPPPVEPPTGEVSEQDIRNAAWNMAYPAGGIALNPEAAFQREARQLRLGSPVTNEFDIGPYRVQGFALGILYARVGDWGNIVLLDW